MTVENGKTLTKEILTNIRAMQESLITLANQIARIDTKQEVMNKQIHEINDDLKNAGGPGFGVKSSLFTIAGRVTILEGKIK